LGARSCQGRQPPKAGAAGQPLQDLPPSHTRPPRSTAGNSSAGCLKTGPQYTPYDRFSTSVICHELLRPITLRLDHVDLRDLALHLLLCRVILIFEGLCSRASSFRRTGRGLSLRRGRQSGAYGGMMPNVRPAALTVSGLATARPAPTNPTSSPTLKPRAQHGLRASIRCGGQHLQRPALFGSKTWAGHVTAIDLTSQIMSKLLLCIELAPQSMLAENTMQFQIRCSGLGKG